MAKDMDLTASFFFPDFTDEYRGLFQEEEPVWGCLDRLKGFLRDNIRPNLPDFVEPGVPLAEPVALLPGGWAVEGFQLVCSDDTGGRIEVWIEGEAVPGATVLCAGAVFVDRRVELGQGVLVEPGAYVKGPAIIGDGTEVRQGAYLRGDCLIGRNCVVGHTTEVKHAIFMDGAKAGHFAYIGDSVLGQDVNLGAGTKFANLKFASGTVSIRLPDGTMADTGRRKIGAILGDGCQTGCNSVTNPGVLLGPGSVVAPNTTVRPGFYRARSVIR